MAVFRAIITEEFTHYFGLDRNPWMKTTQFTYEDVIGYAILIEQRGIELYTNAAEAVNNEPARNLLLHLAEQEKQHEKYFKQLKREAISQNSSYIEMDDHSIGYVAALAQSEIFSDDFKAYDQEFRNIQDVIEFGMQTEKDSILFYVELSKLDWKENTKEILENIIREEKKHLVQLVELRNLVEERGIYY